MQPAAGHVHNLQSWTSPGTLKCLGFYCQLCNLLPAIKISLRDYVCGRSLGTCGFKNFIFLWRTTKMVDVTTSSGPL